MSTNILITGAAGYIGGSLVADFVSDRHGLHNNVNVIAAVRSEEQAQALQTLGITVLQLDLADVEAVTKKVQEHNIDIVIQTASSITPDLSLPLITALGKQRETTGKQTYFIHTSGMSAFYEKTGWPQGDFSDTGPIFETEKRLEDSFPIRKTDVSVIEHAKAHSVTSFTVIPSTVFGRGTGPWNQLSVVLPVYIKACIVQGKVFRFSENTRASFVHISDLTALYGQIVSKVVRKEPIESGEKGYYFALAFPLYKWDFADCLAQALEARQLIKDTGLSTWTSDEEAADMLGVPSAFVGALWNAGETVSTNNEKRLGWKPVWTKEIFLQNIDGEVEDVLQLGAAKSSLIDSLHAAAKQ